METLDKIVREKIIYKIEFESIISKDEIRSITLDYFQEQGFKLRQDGVNLLQFERGSLLRNMVTFNPLKWKSFIEITFDKNKVIANFDINSTYQLITIKKKSCGKNLS